MRVAWRGCVGLLAAFAALVACQGSGTDSVAGPDASAGADASPGADASADALPGDALRPVVELAVNQASVSRIIVDDVAVYWLREGVGLGVGAAMMLVKGETVPTELHGKQSIASPAAIGQDDAYVYVATNDYNGGSFQRVNRFAKDGGPAEWFEIGVGAHFVDLVVAGTGIITARQSDAPNENGYIEVTEPWGSVARLAVAEGPTLGLARVAHVAASATQVYAATTEGILTIDRPVDGGAADAGAEASAPTPTNGAARALVLANGALYWIDHGKIRRRVLEVGRAAEDLVTGLDDPRALAVHGAVLYWTDGANGTIARADATDGGARAVVAVGQGEPVGIAVDDAGAIYWTDRQAGAVRSIAAP